MGDAGAESAPPGGGGLLRIPGGGGSGGRDGGGSGIATASAVGYYDGGSGFAMASAVGCDDGGSGFAMASAAGEVGRVVNLISALDGGGDGGGEGESGYWEGVICIPSPGVSVYRSAAPASLSNVMTMGVGSFFMSCLMMCSVSV